MLDNQHPTRARYLVLAWLPFPHSLLWLFILCLAQLATCQQFRNLSIPVTSPQMVYTPFVCNSTTVLANPQSCAGAWKLSNSSDAGSATVSVSGPSLASANIIPQLFFQFRAFDLFLTTLPSSNATVNITVSSNGTAVSTLFNSTFGSVTVINLPGDVVSLFTITFVSSTTPTRFDLQSIIITALADGAITSILPPATLPPSISVPTFTVSSSTTSILPSSTSPAPVQASSKNKKVAEAVGLTVGLGLGLTALSTVGLYCWKRRRQRQRNVPMQEAHSEWRNERSRYP